HRTLDLKKVIFSQRKFVEEERYYISRTIISHFQAYSIAIPAGQKFSFKCHTEVGDLFLVQVKLAVSRHPELVASDDLHPREQVTDKFMYYGRQKNKVTRSAARLILRQFHYPWQRPRGLN